MPAFREIENTADLGIEFDGVDLPALFACAGEAIFGLIADSASIGENKKLARIVDTLFSLIPSGVGSEGAIPKLSKPDEKRLLRDGAQRAVAEGYGGPDDLSYMGEDGRLATADADLISDRALERGLKQAGTLGSGNHFLEIERVEEIHLTQAAESLGLFPIQALILIYTGSRGLSYQTCEDSLKVMNQAMPKYNITPPDRQLACTPILSPEGQDYLAAMAAAANYAWADRAE